MTDKERFIAELRILLAKHQVVLEAHDSEAGDCWHTRVSFNGKDWWEYAPNLIPELGPYGRTTD